MFRTHKSVLGYSFEKPSYLAIQETGCDINKLILGPDAAVPETSSDLVSTIEGSNANDISDGFNAFVIDNNKKVESTPTPDELVKVAPIAINGCLQFYTDNKPFIDQINSLFKANQTLAKSPLGNDSLNNAFDLTPYKNNKSGLYGVSFYQIGGYSIPGLDKIKQYYLLSADQKFIIEIRYMLSCDALDQIEHQYSNIQNNSEVNDYENALKAAIPTCDQTNFSAKTDVNLFLDTFRVTK